MDVRNLQLLDWLIWDDVTPCQVTAIGCDYIETTKCGITLAESHLLKPIPITPEILEKNGFVCFAANYWKMQVDNDYIELRPIEDNMAHLLVPGFSIPTPFSGKYPCSPTCGFLSTQT